MEMISPEVEAAYYEKFGRLIPVAPWFGEDVVAAAEAEAVKAIAGERGPIEDGEFELECPPDAEV